MHNEGQQTKTIANWYLHQSMRESTWQTAKSEFNLHLPTTGHIWGKSNFTGWLQQRYCIRLYRKQTCSRFQAVFSAFTVTIQLVSYSDGHMPQHSMALTRSQSLASACRAWPWIPFMSLLICRVNTCRISSTLCGEDWLLYSDLDSLELWTWRSRSEHEVSFQSWRSSTKSEFRSLLSPTHTWLYCRNHMSTCIRTLLHSVDLKGLLIRQGSTELVTGSINLTQGSTDDLRSAYLLTRHASSCHEGGLFGCKIFFFCTRSCCIEIHGLYCIPQWALLHRFSKSLGI